MVHARESSWMERFPANTVKACWECQNADVFLVNWFHEEWTQLPLLKFTYPDILMKGYRRFLFDNTETQVFKEEESEMESKKAKVPWMSKLKLCFCTYIHTELRTYKNMNSWTLQTVTPGLWKLWFLSYCYHRVCAPACQHFCVGWVGGWVGGHGRGLRV